MFDFNLVKPDAYVSCRPFQANEKKTHTPAKRIAILAEIQRNRKICIWHQFLFVLSLSLSLAFTFFPVRKLFCIVYLTFTSGTHRIFANSHNRIPKSRKVILFFCMESNRSQSNRIQKNKIKTLDYQEMPAKSSHIQKRYGVKWQRKKAHPNHFQDRYSHWMQTALYGTWISFCPFFSWFTVPLL